MEMSIRAKALNFLHVLIKQPLIYAIKSPDTELYDFGFGQPVEVLNQQGKQKIIGTYTLHALCRFKVICRSCEHKVDKYYEDTPCEKFHSEINRLIGLKVRRVELSNKNDLWLDFGNYWVVFATFENGEESWRVFTSNIDIPHLVASDSWLHFSE